MDVRDVARAVRRVKTIVELKYAAPAVSDRRVVYDERRHNFDIFMAGLRCRRIRAIHIKIDRACNLAVDGEVPWHLRAAQVVEDGGWQKFSKLSGLVRLLY